MAGSEAKAAFELDLEGNVVDAASKQAEALQKLAATIDRGEASIKGMSNALKALNQAQVVDIATARSLQSKIDAQRESVARANAEILKHGATYTRVAEQQKKFTKQQDEVRKKFEAAKEKKAAADADKLKASIQSAQGPTQGLQESVSKLGTALTSTEGALSIAASGALLLVAALAAATVAVVAFGVAALASFGKFVVESANVARSANLIRAAFAGSSENARNLGSQVDALAAKLPTPRAELNQMSADLAEAGFQGQQLVDVLNAVAQSKAAGANKAAAKIEEIVGRGKITQRFALGAFELQGTGLEFGEVASALASNLKVGIGEAQSALFQGRVKLSDGAAALRTAVEAKFGKINVSKMLDLDVILAKVKENAAALVSDVKVEPLLQDLQGLGTSFSDATVTGLGMKKIATVIGQTLVDSVRVAIPVVKGFIEGALIGALKLYVLYLKVRVAFRDAFGDPDTKTKIDAVNLAVKVGTGLVLGLATAALAVGASVAIALTPIVAFTVSLYQAYNGASLLIDKLGEVPKAIDAIATNPKVAITGGGDFVKTTIENKIGVKLPGFAQGGVVPGAQGEPVLAVVHGGEEVIPAGRSRTSANDNGGGGRRELVIRVIVEGDGGGSSSKATPASIDGFRAQLRRALLDELLEFGISPVEG